MRPPFPGMDPWLEDPEIWPNVHNSLVISIRDVLLAQLRPRYFVDVESRMTVLSGTDQDRMYRPDVEIRAKELNVPARAGGVTVMEHVEAKPFHVVVEMPPDEIEEVFLTIQELPGRQVVTVIEVLSPTNKRTRDARKQYLDKRRELLGSGVNFVEIDLLRAGRPMPPQKARLSSDYRLLVFRPRLGRMAHLYGFSYKTEIPQIPIPLLPQDSEPSLDLNRILHALYERAGYDMALDYRRPPQPRLRKQDEAWAASIISQASAEIPPSPAEGETAP
jgi:Protein of unknown function (DUF4058)